MITKDAERPIKPLELSGPAVEYDKLRSALLAEIARLRAALKEIECAGASKHYGKFARAE